MKKVILLFCLLLLTKSFCQSLNQGTIQSKDYYAEIPFEYINGKIIIPVTISEKTYRFIFDTGAPNVLSKQLANTINPNLKSTVTVTDANNKSAKTGLVSIPTLTIGNIVFSNSGALVHLEEKNVIFDCFEIDGFIGSNLFRNSVIQIDTKNKIMTITNDKKLLKYSKKNQLKVKLSGSQKSPFIALIIGKDGIGKEWVLFDTGMSNFYDLSKNNYDVFKKYNIFTDLGSSIGGDSMGIFGSEQDSLKIKCLLSDMKVGTILFKNIEVTTTNSDESRVGTAILNHNIATLDYKDKKMYFDLYPEFIDKPFIDKSTKDYGITMNISNNKLVVGIVWDEMLKSKITVGDEVININGTNYENESICKIIAGKSAMKSKESNKITIKNKDGELIKLTI